MCIRDSRRGLSNLRQEDRRGLLSRGYGGAILLPLHQARSETDRGHVLGEVRVPAAALVEREEEVAIELTTNRVCHPYLDTRGCSVP